MTSRPVQNRGSLSRQLTESEQRWLRVRNHVREHRYGLAVSAARGYPEAAAVEGTPLLSTPRWLPEHPIPLEEIELHYTSDAGFTGTEPAARRLLPVRADGRRYHRYSEVVAELNRPGIFENRCTYRLLSADWQPRPRMMFSRGVYFDGIDVGDAAAHEYTAVTLGETPTHDLRDAIGDPCDPARRSVNVSLSTLTLRHNRATGAVTFPLHRRDGATVSHAAGMYHVLPVGVFQPAGEESWNITNDFSLWRCIVRELAEELRGETEDYHTGLGPIDYDAWPLAARLTRALDSGQVHAFCLGIGVDPLTLATDILTVVVIDSPLYDELFHQVTDANTEGSIVSAVPFTAQTVEQYACHEPTQAAGAALLKLAWRHRSVLVG